MTKEIIDRDAILTALEEDNGNEIVEDLVVLYETKGDKRNAERSKTK